MNGRHSSRRDTFARDHPESFFLDPADAASLSAYLDRRHVLKSGELVRHVGKAGDGNMNCTLRIVTTERRLIVKQGRPWVEKYDHIDAPWGRTAVEGAFYNAVSRAPGVATRMPALLDLDAGSQVLVLDDVGGADLTCLYAGATIGATAIASLTAYLLALHAIDLDAAALLAFANRDMRALNHEHMFRVPLREANGLDLDAITPGLQALADDVKHDARFGARVESLGRHYLAPGRQLVHGDFFPGSWLERDGEVFVIDPEFCVCRPAEFDVGVLLAHLIISDQPTPQLELMRRAFDAGYDATLVNGFAGVEIMRRLMGVAQLPYFALVERKRELLERARQLVCE